MNPELDHEEEESLVQLSRRRPQEDEASEPERATRGLLARSMPRDTTPRPQAQPSLPPPPQPSLPPPPRQLERPLPPRPPEPTEELSVELAPLPGEPEPARRGEFTDERFVRMRGGGGAQQGWRKTLSSLTGGAVSLAPGKAEMDRQATLVRLRMPVEGCRRIAVMSRKGGVGKTTVTLLLGHSFATERPDRVVALDANPDAGTLGYRVEGLPGRTLTDLLDDAESITRYSDVRRYTSQAPSRLEIMASDDDPRITRGFGELEYEAAVEVLERHYNLMLTDTGTDITHSVMSGILNSADQVVVVAGPSLDGARAASKTFDWLEQNGHGYLVRGAVVAVNGVHRRSLVDLQQIADHFGGRCRAVLPIPWDRALEAGAKTSLDDLQPATRAAYLELAAAVADGFGPQARKEH